MVLGFSDLMVLVKWFNEISLEYYKFFRVVCFCVIKRKFFFNWFCVIFRDWFKK